MPGRSPLMAAIIQTFFVYLNREPDACSDFGRSRSGDRVGDVLIRIACELVKHPRLSNRTGVPTSAPPAFDCGRPGSLCSGIRRVRRVEARRERVTDGGARRTRYSVPPGTCPIT